MSVLSRLGLTVLMAIGIGPAVLLICTTLLTDTFLTVTLLTLVTRDGGPSKSVVVITFFDSVINRFRVEKTPIIGCDC